MLAGPAPAETKPNKVQDIYRTLPMVFEANRGQTDRQVSFVAHGSGYSLFLTPTEAVLSLRRADPTHTSSVSDAKQRAKISVLRMSWTGGNSMPQMAAENELRGKVNYLRGKDLAKWRTNIPTFGRVRYRNLYPGIDLLFYGAQQQLEYDLVLAPGADPQKIKLSFEGMSSMRVAANGDLVLSFPEGDVYEQVPVVYQERNGRRELLSGKYVIRAGNQVGIEVGRYDHSRALVIDPTLSYSTYIGGSALDDVTSIAVDGNGRAYVTGLTDSTDFPVKNALQSQLNGPAGSADTFVSKFWATGGGLIYSTYFGGSDTDEGLGIGVDSSGNAYLVGFTASSDFPTTSGAFQTALRGGSDAFVTKLSPSGCCLVYSTYLGGSGGDSANGMALDSNHRVYVTGGTGSVDFPLVNPAQAAMKGESSAFVTRLNASGSALSYSTYLGGSGQVNSARGIAVDSSNRAYVTGSTSSSDFPVTPGAFQPTFAGGTTTREEEGTDAFLTRFSASGGQFSYSTYLGGSANEGGTGVAVDSSSRAYVTGGTDSKDFPVTDGAFQHTNHGMSDVFVTRFNATGSALSYSTYLGASSSDTGFSIAVNSLGQAHVAGITNSSNFPVKNAIQATLGGNADAFVAKLFSSGGGRHYSTYLGGSGREIALAVRLDGSGNAYVGGETCSSNFPTTSGAFRRKLKGTCDGFATKIVP